MRRGAFPGFSCAVRHPGFACQEQRIGAISQTFERGLRGLQSAEGEVQTATIEGGRIEIAQGQRIEATRLSLAQVKAQAEKLWSLPLAERKKIVGLPPQRADVILTGVTIYEAVMEEFGFGNLRVSMRGLRYAALMDGN